MRAATVMRCGSAETSTVARDGSTSSALGFSESRHEGKGTGSPRPRGRATGSRTAEARTG